MTDRVFTNPNFARVEQHGKEVRLVFVADNVRQATNLADNILRQLKTGAIMIGKPASVVKE